MELPQSTIRVSEQEQLETHAQAQLIADRLREQLVYRREQGIQIPESLVPILLASFVQSHLPELLLWMLRNGLDEGAYKFGGVRRWLEKQGQLSVQLQQDLQKYHSLTQAVSAIPVGGRMSP